jgi:5-methylcytosine-specific restriction endonuclease McrA
MGEPKRCTRCGTEYPATTEYFYRRAGVADGLKSHCKNCEREQSRQYRVEHVEERRECLRQYRAAHAEELRESYRHYHAEHASERNEASRIYKLEHPEEMHEYSRRYYAEHAEERGEYAHRYYAEHVEERGEYARRYRAQHPDKMQDSERRRRAREASLPFNFSTFAADRALEYFHGCCAVCGKPLRDLFGDIKPHFDHWIPLSDPRENNPGTVTTNMVGLCNKCNMSKHDHDPIDWLNMKFDQRKAKRIIQRVETYFDWVRRQDAEEDKADQ